MGWATGKKGPVQAPVMQKEVSARDMPSSI